MHIFITSRLSDQSMKGVHYILNNSFKFPLAEVIVNSLSRFEIKWEHSPLASCLVDVKNRIHDFSKRIFACSFLRIDDFFNNFPLIISEVSLIFGFHNVSC